MSPASRPPFAAALFVAFVAAAAVPAARGDLVTHVDFTDFQARLDDTTAVAGVANFSAAERTLIETNVLAGLRRAYREFDVTFNPFAGGNSETVSFGLTDAGGGFGLADSIDYRNRLGGQLGRVFAGNFGGFIEAADPRATQIQELSTSLAGTAVHELGHNLGLLHQDSYGNDGFTFTGLGGTSNSGGRQNLNFMATGSTGLGEAQREVDREFSQWSKLKLEFAEDLTVAGPPASVAEAGGNNSMATAQGLMLAEMTVSGLGAVNLVGAIGAANENDWFSFDVTESGFLTASTITDGLGGAADTLVSIFDAAGTLLGRTDDTNYDGDVFGSGTTLRSRDSLLYGLRFDAAGRYFAQVEGFGSSSGNYELLLGFDADAAAVPEPSGLLLIGFAALAAGAARRRRPAGC